MLILNGSPVLKRVDKMPQVSICLPVYNGERYLHDVFASIRTQTFEDYEVIISDNASTDRTQEICLAFSSLDARVKYFRAGVNRGLAWNLNRTFELATGIYAMWICHDDVMGLDYIRRCVEVLEEDEKSILCFANCSYIGSEGELIKRVDLPNTGAAETPSERFEQVLYNAGCDPFSGLMKVEFLKHTRLHAGYADSDRVLLAEMSFRGRFRRIPEYLFSKRIHPLQATAQTDRWQRTLIFDPRKKGTLVCPWWREFFGFVGAIQRAPISCEERFKAYKYLYWWALVHRAVLYQDLRRGLRYARERTTAE
jgi:glycosyltransferase involved in cell wall biosynthesis